MGEIELVFMKFSWLGELVPVFWWMEVNPVFPKVRAKFSSMFWAVCGFGITLSASLLMCRVVALFC